MIKIREPIWKTRSIGIAEYKLKDITEIQITYKNKTRERIYPDTYIITKEKALTYPVQIIKGISLRIIPISDLQIKEKK